MVQISKGTPPSLSRANCYSKAKSMCSWIRANPLEQLFNEVKCPLSQEYPIPNFTTYAEKLLYVLHIVFGCYILLSTLTLIEEWKLKNLGTRVGRSRDSFTRTESKRFVSFAGCLDILPRNDWKRKIESPDFWQRKQALKPSF